MKPISTRIKVVCQECGEDLSSWTRGDFFASADDQELSHECQVIIADNGDNGRSRLHLLKVEVLPTKIITEGDDMGVGEVWESTERYTTLAYPATVGDLDRVTHR